MDKKVSVIIPVYNVEKYLNQCVDSIINQSYKNIEIILVDDGSHDNCPKICDEYADNEDNINVIHKENGGLSDARNTGLKSATGDYILFVDSDDFIEQDSLASVMKIAFRSDADVVFLEAQKYFSEGSTVPLGDGITAAGVRGKSKEEVLTFLASCPKFPASACTKLIKRSLFSDDLLFEKGLLSEDIDWSLRLLIKTESFDYCDVMYYNYRQQRAGSITNTVGLKNFCDILYILKKWVAISEKYSGAEKNFILSQLAYEFSILIMLYSKISNVDKKRYKKELKSLLWLLDYRCGIRYSGVKKLCKLFGFNITSNLLRLYLKIR